MSDDQERVRPDAGTDESTRNLEHEAETERGKAEERDGIDREVEAELQTVRPGSAAPSRAGIKGSGSSADTEQGNAGAGEDI